MEQRSLRLGDIVDDYCPRERRVTNHAIVALVGNAIKQTRCSTCDSEHEYKEAKVPKKRPKSGSELAGGVLVTKAAASNGAAQDSPVADEAAAAAVEIEVEEVAASSNGAEAPEANGQPEGGDRPPDSWFSHRPLIRASLPKTDGEP